MTKIRFDAKYDFEQYLRMYCMPTRSVEQDYKIIVERKCGGDVE